MSRSRATSAAWLLTAGGCVLQRRWYRRHTCGASIRHHQSPAADAVIIQPHLLCVPCPQPIKFTRAPQLLTMHGRCCCSWAPGCRAEDTEMGGACGSVQGAPAGQDACMHADAVAERMRSCQHFVGLHAGRHLTPGRTDVLPGHAVRRVRRGQAVAVDQPRWHHPAAHNRRLL